MNCNDNIDMNLTQQDCLRGAEEQAFRLPVAGGAGGFLTIGRTRAVDGLPIWKSAIQQVWKPALRWEWPSRAGLILAGLLLPVCLWAAPGRVVELTGVTADGVTVNTITLQAAIDACSAWGGGVLHFPAGRYVTGTLQLKDNVVLHLDAEATILGSTNAADYRNLDPFIDGVGSKMGYALIVAVGAQSVGLEGPGTIDGRGKAVKAVQAHYDIRPFLVRWVKCQDVTVKDVHLINSGAWTMNFFQSKHAMVEGVSIRSLDLVNNDGIDLDSCADIDLKGCVINSGDDAICLKATSPVPCQNITAEDCQLQTRCNAIKFGTESLGDFTHIRVSHCQIHDTRLSGIALNTVDGSHLTDVVISDITMNRVTVPITMRLGARLKVFRTGDQPRPPGVLRDITIKDVQATGTGPVGMLINGLPGHPVENLTLENIRLEVPGGGPAADAAVVLAEKPATYPEWNMFGKVIPAYGIYLRHAQGVTLKNIHLSTVKPDARLPYQLIDVAGVNLKDLARAITLGTP